MAYQVKAPLVIAKNEQGADLYVYENGFVPTGQSEDWIKQHVESGMIAEVEPAPSDDAEDKPMPRRRAASDD